MRYPRIIELPYRPDSAALFDAVAHEPWAQFLDSGRPFCDQGRYDIIVARPMATLTVRGGTTELRGGFGSADSDGDPFDLLRDVLRPGCDPVPGLPFAGGALGYFAYDLGRHPALAARLVDRPRTQPDMAVGIYDWALVVDHGTCRTRLVARGRDPDRAALWPELVHRFRQPPPATPSTFAPVEPARSNMTYAQYADAFGRIKDYIRDGDCYQVNLSQQFAARVSGPAWHGYRALRRLNPAPFAAFLNTPDGEVLSCSPERFLQVRERTVVTRPIKGTRPRARHPQEDLWLAELLRASAKDRAENVMIVDLLRNDLGRVCEYGSVRVPGLFEVESFATVHHLVSTVTGRLAADRDAVELLRACFPGGSITGAPKLRAMEIIDELEPHTRGVYCGSIGYIGFDGAMDSNIAIRTLVHRAGALTFAAGGGIVADSAVAAEYQETFDKAAALLRWLERLEPDHVDREARRQSGHG